MNSKHSCYHCGEPCDERITIDSKHFCCTGCKTVFQIISESDLTTYYSLNQNPGIKSRTSRLDFLDNPEIQKRFIVFENDTSAKVDLKLPDIHCTSCIWLLENLRKLNPAVLSSKVNFSSKKASILFDKDQISLKQLSELLSAIGYSPDFSEEANKIKSRKSSQLIRKVAVAGFCFGNSMLISIPEYLDTQLLIEESFSRYFGLINLLLSIPVLFFSATGYFKSSWASLKNLHINMDLPIAIGILALFGRSVFEIITTVGPGYIDSMTGLVFFLLVGQWYQSKTYEALSFDRDYKSFFPIAVTRIDNESESHIPLELMKKGDLIKIHQDEIIPADGEIVSGIGEIDYSFITGESKTEHKNQGDKIFAGGRQKGPSILMKTEQLIQAGHLTALWNQQSGKAEKARLEEVTHKIAPYFVSVVLILALVSGVYWGLNDPTKVWLVVSAVLIVACPCALALAAPFGLGQAMRAMGKNNLYLRSVSVIEDIAKSKTIVFDKTGTLTQSRSQPVQFSGELTAEELSWLSALTHESLHPKSLAINKWTEVDYSNTSVDDFQEFTGKGVRGSVQGHSIVLGNSQLASYSVPGTHLLIDGEYRGTFQVSSEYRPGALGILEKLKENFRLLLFSGDNYRDKDFLRPYFNELHFQQKPEDKLLRINKLSYDSKTMMVGDGLNDAGALEKADVGIAVVEDLHKFSPASDAILHSDELYKLPEFIEFSNKTINVVYAAFVLSFLYNIIGLSFAVTGNLTPLLSAILMPISSITVVVFVSMTTAYLGRRILKLTKVIKPSASNQGVSSESEPSLHMLNPA